MIIIFFFISTIGDRHNISKRHGGTFQFEVSWFTNTSFIATTDPINVNYIANKN
ncbi:hypothetical protein MTR_6g084060 [Medicago truncatula]|uniref:Uncharacterized protein n=1 Tax=Medicago truncatula TaxID=3880 RepID=G7KN10_MEDTR|nr:hypothetical protein MTR_6g084060 [Medicago truncatula]